MSLRNEQSKFAEDVGELISWCFFNGYEITFGEALRTKEQQKIYFDNKKSNTMESNHLVKLAIDMNFFIKGELTYDKKDLQQVGDFWESLDEKNRWGGNFKSILDTPHFERNL